MDHRKTILDRRAFLKLGSLALGSSILACGGSEKLVEVTATLIPGSADTAPPTLAPGQYADMVLANGNLITMDSDMPSAQALAVKNGRILQIGSDDGIRALAGPETKLVELAGRTVTPGMIDAHNHLQVWGTLLDQYVPLLPPDVRTLDNLLAKLSEEAPGLKAGEWLQGYFWVVDPLPSRHDLDGVLPDNPVWLIQQGGHYGVANSLALDIAGITAETQDPTGGIIERDEAGDPTGRLYNHRAMDLLRVHAPQPDTQQILKNLHFAEMRMVADGVTTFQDVNARFSAIEAYLEAGRSNSMTMRSQVFYTLEWPADLQRALEEIEPYADDFMRFAGYKFLIDGQFPTWYTHEPHPGIRWDMPTWDPDKFKQAVQQLHDTGLQIAVHCGGDAAVDLVLEAYEEAMNANPRPDPRHRLEHATLTRPGATQKAADLGVQISSQPQFLRFSGNVEEQLGAERAGRLIVNREWLDAGINVALGSDTPTSLWTKPQITLLGAVTRLGPNDESFHPEQAMTIQEALHAHTMGSAHAAFEETLKGSLSPGKFADFVVWSDDFTVVDPLDIANVEAEMTVIEGEVVYESS